MAATPCQPPHENLLLDLSEQEFMLWRHNPITSAYLKYLEDQIEAFRFAAADLLEAGSLPPQAEVIRGRILTLRELQNALARGYQEFLQERGRRRQCSPT